MGKYLDLARQYLSDQEIPAPKPIALADTLSSLVQNGPQESMTRLRDYDTEKTRHPQDSDKTVDLGNAELESSMRRLEARGVNIAVFEDGSMRVVITEDETLNAIDAGGTIYPPRDMYHFVQLEPRERRMLHSFKKRLGGTTEWRKS